MHLMTNYEGKYLGHPDLDPVFNKLNGISAIVFIHSIKPCMFNDISTQPVDATLLGSQYQMPMFEFFSDTARAIINLFSSGMMDGWIVVRLPPSSFLNWEVLCRRS